MRIQSRISVSIVASLAVSGILAFLAFSVVRGIGDDLARGRGYGAVISKAFALNLLVATFDQESGQREMQQVGDVRTSLTKLLHGLSSSDAREESLVHQIQRNNQELGPLLDQFFAPRKEQDSSLRAELKKMLATQIWTKVRFITDDTYRLMESSESRIVSAHTKAAITVLSLLITLILANVIISLVSGRSIVRMQEGLRQQREWLKVTLASIGDAVIATDPECRIAFLNPVAADLTGWRIEEALDRPVRDVFRIIDEETREPAEDILERVLREGSIVALANHTALIARDGREIPIEDSAAPIRDAAGKVSGVVIVFHDVTEKRRALDALRENEDRLRLAIDSTELGTWDFNPATGTVNWSDRCNTAFGLPPGSYVDYPTFLNRLHPDDRPRIHEDVQQALDPAGSGHYDAEYRALWADGTERWIVAKGRAYFGAAEGLRRAVRFTGTVLDVTDRKRTEIEREMTVELLRLTNRSTGMSDLISGVVTFFQQRSGCEAVGIRLKEGDDYPYHEARGFPEAFIQLENQLCARDTEGNILRDSAGNPYMECMCGNVIRGRVDASKPFFTAGGSFWANSTTSLLASTSDADRQARTRNRCNGEGYESVALIPLHLGTERLGLIQLNDRRKGMFSAETIEIWERLAGYLAVALARYRTEEELRRSNDELESRVRERTAALNAYMAKLEESNQALQDFASIASHDLQEPLRKVMTFGSMLGQKYGASLGEQGKDYLERMLGATGRMQSLLSGLLSYSRVTTLGEPFRKVELSTIIREVLSDLEVRIQKTGGEVHVGELPHIQADPTQMRQLFQNLIGNGLKFHREGEKPIVRVHCHTTDQSFRIVVEDDGIGFEERHLDKIFSPFQRLHGKSSRYEGTGMGLAICKRIVERHGGAITAKSAPGQGAAFVVTMPREPRADGDQN
jgi:PAS domain S-box-containing protein